MPKYRPFAPIQAGRQRGFTIIELMITVVILAILTLVAAPAMRDMIVRNRLYGQASELHADLQFARNESFRRQQRVVVCNANATYDGCATTAGWTNGWIVFNDANNDGLYTTASEEVMRVHQALPSGVTITTSPSSNSTYYRSIGVSDAARTFTVCQTGFIGRVVSVTVTGRTSSAPTTATCS